MSPHLLTRRALLRTAGSLAALSAAGCGVPPITDQPPRLRLLGETTLPHRMKFKDTTVGGLSALDYEPVGGLWAAISDDRSEHQPARFYRLAVDVSAAGIDVRPQDVSFLLQANGQPFPNAKQGGEVPDPESLRLLPDGRLLWSSEGDKRLKLPPFIREARLDGRFVREFQLPALLRFDGAPGTGPRNNATLEGLALTPDGSGLWAAMESPLEQDGPLPTVGAPGGPCRFTLFDVASGQPQRQIAYVPDAIPAAPIPPGSFADNGVSEILMLDADRLLVLERAFMMGRGLSLRLYAIDVREGSDTLAQPALRPGDYRAPRKALIADFAQLGLSRLDNTEGMTWGPRLPNGARTLVFVSDDNFNPLQVTQFVACEFLD